MNLTEFLKDGGFSPEVGELLAPWWREDPALETMPEFLDGGFFREYEPLLGLRESPASRVDALVAEVKKHPALRIYANLLDRWLLGGEPGPDGARLPLPSGVSGKRGPDSSRCCWRWRHCPASGSRRRSSGCRSPAGAAWRAGSPGPSRSTRPRTTVLPGRICSRSTGSVFRSSAGFSGSAASNIWCIPCRIGFRPSTAAGPTAACLRSAATTGGSTAADSGWRKGGNGPFWNGTAPC